jgi:hypothetical protein
MTPEKIRALAVENGCQPFWYDGMFGWAWHCGCDDNLHCCDQQCSVIDARSAKRNRIHIVKNR